MDWIPIFAIYINMTQNACNFSADKKFMVVQKGTKVKIELYIVRRSHIYAFILHYGDEYEFKHKHIIITY